MTQPPEVMLLGSSTMVILMSVSECQVAENHQTHGLRMLEVSRVGNTLSRFDEHTVSRVHEALL